MEKLSIAISEAVQAGKWHPVKISRNGPSFSHLLFTDDVFLFSKAACVQARLAPELFGQFSAHSSLKVNVSKSRAFFSKGVPRQKIDKIVSITSIRSTPSLDKYIGFPIFKGRVQRADFNFIIDKLWDRLASWKSKLLNKAGRLTLVKSVLTTLPTYYIQLQWLPSSICSHIDRVSRNFLWKGNSDKGIHLVGWGKITLPKKKGGLGVQSSREANTALLGKLVWELHQNPNKLWVSMLLSKYVPNGNFLDYPTKTGSAVWNSVRKAKAVLRAGYTYRIGNGQSLFWYTSWTHFGPLCDHVFAVDIQDTNLQIKHLFFNNQWHWNILRTSLPDFIKQAISDM